MIAYGALVRVVSGRPLREAYVHAQPGKLRGLFGIQRAKVLWTEKMTMVGSCNWTTSSQANHEWVAVLDPSAEGVTRLGQAFDLVRGQAQPYSEVVVEEAAGRRAA